MDRQERRLIAHAFTVWHGLCGDRRCPTLPELEAEVTPALQPFTFVVDTNGVPDSFAFTQCGANLSRGLKFDPAGCRVASLPQTYADHALDLCRVVVRARKPIASSDHVLDRAGNEIRYRLILLPLSNDGEHVDALMGAASFKELNGAGA